MTVKELLDEIEVHLEDSYVLLYDSWMVVEREFKYSLMTVWGQLEYSWIYILFLSVRKVSLKSVSNVEPAAYPRVFL